MMKNAGIREFCILLAVFLVSLALRPAPCTAETYSLTAGVATVVMPDGTPIVMWGFGLNGGPVTAPGPQLAVTDGTLTINLTNTLPEPVSIVIPGKIEQGGMVPVWTDGSSGDRFADPANPTPAELALRVRSFTHEVAPGANGSYTWTGLVPGTYLYQSGTHPSVQIQMGLYGSVNSGPYPGVDNDVTLLFSEIDQELHDAVATGNFGPGMTMTSTIDFQPDYFLINGMPYSPANLPIALGNDGITPLQAGQTVLLRLVNAGLETRQPMIPGASIRIVGEDGFALPNVLLPVPLEQSSVQLPAGKTLDVILDLTTLADQTYFPLYDRRLGLTNATLTGGGMLTYLKIALSEGGSESLLSVVKSGAGTGTVSLASLPGGLDCGVTCSESILTGTTVRLSADPDPGSALVGWSVDGDTTICPGKGDCTITMDTSKTVSATFELLTRPALLTPNDGEHIPADSFYTIRWQAPQEASSFNLFFSKNNGRTWSRIARGVTGSSYAWKVPTPLRNLVNCRIRVDAYNAAGARIGVGRSDGRFAVETMSLDTPNGGETFDAGETVRIAWSTHDTLRPVARTLIHYTINGGRTWKRIAVLPGNPSTYDWTVPALTRTRTKSLIRVIFKDARGVNVGADRSDNFFTINQVAPVP